MEKKDRLTIGFSDNFGIDFLKYQGLLLKSFIFLFDLTHSRCMTEYMTESTQEYILAASYLCTLDCFPTKQSPHMENK